MNISETIIPATEELLSSFTALSASAGIPYHRDNIPDGEGVTGIVHLCGQSTGYVAIHLPQETATQVTKLFLFIDSEEIEAEQVSDAVRELANILAGQLKNSFDPQGSKIKLSLPMTCRGEDFIVANLPGAEKITIPFYTDDGDFFVEVQLASS